ncbi:MAG: lipopolysaccharide heptosyltransferase II [Comamonadaceae bacterium CG1_02_60_18]|nr:MAG: lipopolysaccharide heptosyltransferase II [Comamonadaceae bacterium CG1_02_60_18]PIQ54306.1 MAG: lipopolysaccharide heptosyltransferase II [Comamonadaceae bacterium CG12_big_fil_rev_8_21_14_0_65_59_15]
MTRSLVIAPQWIGDAVMTEPLLRRLHARGEQITVGALPWVAPVYRAMPQVAEVIEFPFAHGGLQWRARQRLARQIDGQFDVAYLCPNSLKSALLPFLARIPQRIGYLGEARVGLLTHRLKNPPKGQRPPMVAFYSALSGDAHVANDRPRLQLNAADVDAALADLGLQRGAYCVLAPGAEYGPAKRWPTRHFAALAAQQDLPVVLLGAAKEADVCDEIARSGTPQRIVNLAGKTSLTQALSVISATQFMVTNDSGLMHVAAGFGVRQVAIFGSSSPLHTPPLNDHAQVLWLKTDAAYQPPLDCAPCFERVCPLGHTRCLNDITPARVLQQLQPALA